MAMKSTKSKPNMDAGGTMQFVGPAQKSFQSFLELTRFTLDTYQPNWNNPINPISYISPPTYTFKNPDKSDLAIDLGKKLLDYTKQQSNVTQPELDSLEKPIIDRRADMGEFMVFQAIRNLVEANVQTPFLAFRGLDLGKQEHYLQQIFPHVQPDIQGRFKNMMREYDFVLIGPRIGVIVIEVKSSCFTKGRDFAQENRHIPDDIVKAITQLDSFDLDFIRECAGLQLAAVGPIRKILFTPNLKKSRLKEWYDSLVQGAKANVDKRLKNVTHWFQDDMVHLSTDSLKPALYNTLRQMIEADQFQMPLDIYELYGPVIVGLGSALVIKSQQLVGLIPEYISTSAAILSDAAALDSQDPRRILHPGAKRRKTEENAKLKLLSKMVLLTPEQQKALNGENYQVIIGAAGTGKTIVLQAKALEILGKGKAVLVFSTPNFSHRYRKLFDDHGFKNYEVRSIWDLLHHLNQLRLRRIKKSMMKELQEHVLKILDHYISLISRGNATQELFNDVISIPKFDAIFIDDAVDMTDEVCFSNPSILFLLFALMAVSKLYYGSKILWMVLDPVLSPQCLIKFTVNALFFYRRTLEQITQLNTVYFSYSCLQQVMRCSESVFQSAYHLEVLGQMAVKPILGHKIHGFRDSVSFKMFEDNQIEPVLQYQQIALASWKHIKRALDRFHQEGFEYGQMAVIFDCDPERILSHCISNKCTECGIPNVTEDLSSEAGNGKLVISRYRSVSSLEWPVVIFVSQMDNCCYYDSWSTGNYLFSKDYQQYRGCSRATMRIFQVNVYRILNNRSWEADIYIGMRDRYTMTKDKDDQHVSNMSETAEQLAWYATGIDEYRQPEVFWKRTMRRSFSVHNLDLSTILVESDRFKTERRNINCQISFASIKSHLHSLLRSVEKSTMNPLDGMPIMDEEIQSTCQTTPVSSQQGNDYYGQLISQTFLKLISSEQKRVAFSDFWIKEMCHWIQVKRYDIWETFKNLGYDLGELTNYVLSRCPHEKLCQKRSLIVQFCSLVRDDKLLCDSDFS